MFKYNYQKLVIMTKIKIEYDYDNCIGAAVCVAVAPDTWELDDNSKAILNNAKDLGNGQFELILDIDDPTRLTDEIEAAKGCPVTVIKVTNLDTGERLV